MSDPGQRVRDKDGKQRALIDAAAEVFAESGYEAAATKEIARRAGCSESLIFRYFTDKQGLFERVVSRVVADAITRSEERVAASLPETFEEFIVQLFLCRLPDDNRVANFEVACRALADSDFSLRVYLPHHQRRTEIIADCVRHYMQLGQVADDIDAGELAELLANVTSFTSCLTPQLFGKTEAEILVQAELAASTFAKGARPTAGSGDRRQRPKFRLATR